TVLTMYDKSVEYISSGSNVGDIKEFFWKWRRHHQPQQQDSLQSSYNLALPNKPEMQSIGIFGAGVADELNEKAEGAGLISQVHFGFNAPLGAPGGARARSFALAMPPAATAMKAVRSESAAWMTDPSSALSGE